MKLYGDSILIEISDLYVDKRKLSEHNTVTQAVARLLIFVVTT